MREKHVSCVLPAILALTACGGNVFLSTGSTAGATSASSGGSTGGAGGAAAASTAEAASTAASAANVASSSLAVSSSSSAASTGAGGGATGASCAFVYVLDTGFILYAFDPKALTFTTIGTLDCPGVGEAGLPGMAIDDDHVLWAAGAKDELYQIDPQNAHCTPTSFPPPAALTDQVGIGFVADTLYLSTEPSLYRVDQPSWQITDVGDFQPNPAPGEGQGPSLAGTSDGRLFGLWLGPPTLGEIDPTSSAVLWSLPVVTSSGQGLCGRRLGRLSVVVPHPERHRIDRSLRPVDEGADAGDDPRPGALRAERGRRSGMLSVMRPGGTRGGRRGGSRGAAGGGRRGGPVAGAVGGP